MASDSPKFDFVPADEAPTFDFTPADDAPQFDFVPAEPAALTPEQLAQSQAAGLATLDTLTLPARFDWSHVNEKLDQQRFAEYLDLNRQADELQKQDPSQSLNPNSPANQLRVKAFGIQQQMSPDTEAGRGAASLEQGARQSSAQAMLAEQTPRETFAPFRFARNARTPSELLGSFMGPGLSSQVLPVAEAAGRQAGAAAGGALAAAKFIPHPGANLAAQLGLPILSSFMGSQVGGAVQEQVLQATETPEETQQRQQQTEEAIQANPGANLMGSVVAQRPFFGPSLAQFARASRGDIGALRNIGIAGTIGGGMAALQGGKPEDIAAGVFLNAFMGEPTKLGRRLGLTPSFEQQAAETAAAHSELPSLPPITGDSDAQQISQASPPNGGVRPSQIAPQDVPLPAAEGGEGVQPGRPGEPLAQGAPTEARKVKPNIHDLVPAIPVGEGEAIGRKGEGHQDILDRLKIENPAAWEKALDTFGEANFFKNVKTGENISRDQFKEWFGRRDAQGLAELQAKETAADEARVAELVKAGMSEAEARAGVARAKAEDVPPVPISPETQPGTVPPPPSTGEPAARGGEDLGATSNKEAVVNAERAARQLDPVVKEVAIENPQTVKHAEDAIAADPELPQRIIERLRSAPPQERTISLEDGGILLIERTKLRARRDAAMARASRKEGSAMEQAIAKAEFDNIEGQLNAMDQAAQDARSTWGRFGQFWQRSMREDFSLANLERRARLSKDEPLTEKDIAGIKAIADKAKKAHEDFDIRQKQIELENRQNAIEGKIAEVSEKAKPVDPVVKSLAERIIARLDVASKNAEKSLRSKLSQLGSGADVSIIADVAKIAAARTAKASIQFAQFSAEMIKKFGDKIRPFLQKGWDQREQYINTAINAGGGTKKKEVAERIKPAKAPLDAAAQQARIEEAIGNRIKEGKPLSSLAPYVNKLQESFIAQGINEREPLIDAVHGALQKHDPNITRDDAMEIMSKYGSDYATPLSKDPIKQTRRQVDGEIQQLLKLRDIAAKVPLPKSGPERPSPGPIWRGLIKAVNAAKKKLGVVVTDPETQLKSSQDAIRTRLRNEIEDMTLEIETGERPPDKTPAEYTQDMEILRGIRDRVRETLREIEGNPQLSEEQKLALTKRSAEESLAMWERRLAGEEARAPKDRRTSPEIEAIRARRDAVRAEVEELNAHDAVLQENKKAEALVRQIEATEALIADNAVKAKVQGADSELVAEAREQLAALRAALDLQRTNDPKRQLQAIEKAEQTLEASIKKLDQQIQTGNIAVKAKPVGLQSERLTYLRAQRDAMVKLQAQMRRDAAPRLSADQLAIKMRTTQMLKRAADLRSRIAAGDFGPRTRKAPVDISGDRAALDAQADLMNVDAEFQKLQEQWKLDQMNFVQKRWRNLGQAWDATANLFLSFDLSTPLQTAFSMAAHPIEGAKAIGKGARAFADQFFRFSDSYARREAARIANSINAKNGLYKTMKLELPSVFGKQREENMASVLEQLAELDARWAGLPDVVKGLYKLEGQSLVKGGKRLASVIPKIAGSGIKASNVAFETIANHMRARTADAMLARWYGRGRGTPTKLQLELLGEQINIATGKGGLRAGDTSRRLLFAPNYYLSIIKQLSGYQLLKSGLYNLEGRVARDIATEYIRAIASMGVVYGLATLFGNREDMTFDPRNKSFAQAKTDKGTAIDITMGRGKWITALAQIGTGELVDERGRVKDVNRKGTALAFAGGRLSRGVASALTSAFGEDYRGKPIESIEIAKDFVIPLGWRNFDDLLRKEGFTRGSFIQLLNLLGVTHNIHD